jgi:flagellum-specific peptidoglycan hydrolase FlgJ
MDDEPIRRGHRRRARPRANGTGSRNQTDRPPTASRETPVVDLDSDSGSDAPIRGPPRRRQQPRPQSQYGSRYVPVPSDQQINLGSGRRLHTSPGHVCHEVESIDELGDLGQFDYDVDTRFSSPTLDAQRRSHISNRRRFVDLEQPGRAARTAVGSSSSFITSLDDSSPRTGTDSPVY